MTNAEKNQIEMQKIRVAYNTGQMTREEAKALAEPIIERINAKAKELSKKYKVRYSPVTFTSLMR